MYSSRLESFLASRELGQKIVIFSLFIIFLFYVLIKLSTKPKDNEINKLENQADNQTIEKNNEQNKLEKQESTGNGRDNNEEN